MQDIRLALIGTGGMANWHATEFSKVPGVKLVACCDIVADRAKAYAEKHGVPQYFSDIDEMFAQADFDAVDVVTSDAAHKAASLKALAAGKHVLCEKPLAPNYPDAREMAEAAVRSGKIHMINFSYRNSSAIHRAAQLVAEGALGQIYHVEAHYLQGWLCSTYWGDWKTSPGWLWRLSTAHGSKGTLGDIGVHILDFASYPVGEIAAVFCKLKTFDKAPGQRIGEYTLDANDSVMITLEFAGGALGTINTTRLATGHVNSLYLSIHGSRGALRIDLDRSYGQLEMTQLDTNGKHREWERLNTPETPTIYRRFIDSIRSGHNDQPDFTRGAAIQKVLDACEASDRAGTWIRLQDFCP